VRGGGTQLNVLERRAFVKLGFINELSRARRRHCGVVWTVVAFAIDITLSLTLRQIDTLP